MKRGAKLRLYFIVAFILLTTIGVFGQSYNYTLQANYTKGFIYPHSPDVANLVIDHPEGFALYLDKKSYGSEYWQQRYNYPDVGYALIYLDYKNPKIGKSIASMVYYNFYIGKNHLNRGDLKFKLGFGASFNTNPYQKEKNNKNNFIGTPLTYGMQLGLYYDYLIAKNIAANAGINVTHFSNASAKKPNKGINVANASIGISYRLTDHKIEYNANNTFENSKKIRYNLVLNGGVNSTFYSGTSPLPFVVVSAYAEKRFGYKSAINLGVDGFVNQSLKESLKYDPEVRDLENKPDYKRIGVAVGHELYVSKLSILTQFGVYVYRPYKKFYPIYQRYAMKYYFNDRLFATFALKTHYAIAETAEWGIGVKL